MRENENGCGTHKVQVHVQVQGCIERHSTLFAYFSLFFNCVNVNNTINIYRLNSEHILSQLEMAKKCQLS